MRRWTQEQLHDIARRAMVEAGFEPDFPPAVVAETKAMTGPPQDPDPAVRDLRGLLWCSIDNDDSRDLDQLSVSEPLGGGATRILVAVADVDAAVRKGSAIDGRAATNTTSVYTPAGVFPMLPERLSTDLTSLNQDQERLAVVVDMTVGSDGATRASEVYRARVLNRAQLAYDAVAAWLDGTAPAPARLSAVRGLDEQIRAQDRAAQAMRSTRHQHGALSLASSEARAVFADGVLETWPTAEKSQGIVLIDEIDVHLHPRWKVEIVSRLRRVFPRVQFIITTHDPLCLLGTRKGEVHVMRRDPESEQVVATQFDVPPGTTADQVLTGFWFGLPSTMDRETVAMIKPIIN